MNFKSRDSYWEFCQATKHGNRYIHSKEVEDFFKAVLDTVIEREADTIEAGSCLWRAQLGHDWQAIKDDREEIIDELPYPYPQERMKPIPSKVSEGRANPKGILYLYLASDKETAMSEQRPGLGATISVGQFKTTKTLRLVDCSIQHEAPKDPYSGTNIRPILDKELSVWKDINNAFSKPVNSNDQPLDYIPTQILAELFKSNGYDGIVYKSSFAAGFNIVLFDLDLANLINCFLYEVGSIDLSFKSMPNSYYIR